MTAFESSLILSWEPAILQKKCETHLENKEAYTRKIDMRLRHRKKRKKRRQFGEKETQGPKSGKTAQSDGNLNGKGGGLAVKKQLGSNLPLKKTAFLSPVTKKNSQES